MYPRGLNGIFEVSLVIIVKGFILLLLKEKHYNMICFVLLTKYLKTYLIAFNNNFFIEIKKIYQHVTLTYPGYPVCAVNNLMDIGIEASMNFHKVHYAKQSIFLCLELKDLSWDTLKL